MHQHFLPWKLYTGLLFCMGGKCSELMILLLLTKTRMNRKRDRDDWGMFCPEYSSIQMAGKLFTCGVIAVIWTEQWHFYKQNASRERVLPEQATLKLQGNLGLEFGIQTLLREFRDGQNRHCPFVYDNGTDYGSQYQTVLPATSSLVSVKRGNMLADRFLT